MINDCWFLCFAVGCAGGGSGRGGGVNFHSFDFAGGR